MKSMARDCGNEVKVALKTDSASGRGISFRLGARKVRHVDTQWLWLQRVFHRREATIPKIPGRSTDADFMTTFFASKKFQDVNKMEFSTTKEVGSRCIYTEA